MAERIDLPIQPSGTPEEQLRALYNYLYRMASTINRNIYEQGTIALTDDEQILMNQLNVRKKSQTQQIVPAGIADNEQETLKSLIIKTAKYLKDQVDAINIAMYGTTDPNSTKQKQGMFVDIDDYGVKRTYMVTDLAKLLKKFELNTKTYIKAGLLRTEGNTPVYGVAIGKDVITFDSSGAETFDPDKVALEIIDEKITAKEEIHGDLVGDVTGDLTGNVTGNVTGNLTGNVTGNVTGNLTGQVENATTEETDLDDITDPGTYFLVFGSLTHEPPTLPPGSYWLTVAGGGTGNKMQRIDTIESIYIRKQASGTWGSWYRYDGTLDA